MVRPTIRASEFGAHAADQAAELEDEDGEKEGDLQGKYL